MKQAKSLIGITTITSQTAIYRQWQSGEKNSKICALILTLLRKPIRTLNTMQNQKVPLYKKAGNIVLQIGYKT